MVPEGRLGQRAQILRYCKFSVTIPYTTIRDTSGHFSYTSLIVKCRFSRMMRFTFCFNASVITEGRPDLSASWTSIFMYLKRKLYQCNPSIYFNKQSRVTEKCRHTQLSLPIKFGRQTAADSYYVPLQRCAPHDDPSRRLRRDKLLYGAYQLFTQPWQVQPGPIKTLYV